MRFLGVGETCDLGALYLRLQAEGHAVKVAVAYPESGGTMRGLVQRAPDWRAELDWVRAAPDLGIVLFESVSEGFGALQDRLRANGLHVVGGSAFGDRLENDRAYAQRLLGELGLRTAGVWEFERVDAAVRFIEAEPRRYVLKFSGAEHEFSDTYVGRFPDGRDVIACLAQGGAAARRLILMEFVDGVEMGVGAYFDGERFLTPACLDFEHKRFFPGDLGELTGEMGTVATYDRTGRFFEMTLKRIEPLLREHRHVGYVNLNTIANERGVYPLEFTCRFGYPGYAVLDPLQGTPWSELLTAMATRRGGRFETRPGFSLGVVLTTPPFPYTRREVAEPVGLPVLFEPPGPDPAHMHYGEVGLDARGRLVTSGLYGWTLVVTGIGETIAAAKEAAYERVGRVMVPNVRYRSDIGDRLIAGDFHKVERLGLLDACPNAPE